MAARSKALPGLAVALGLAVVALVLASGVLGHGSTVSSLVPPTGTSPGTPCPGTPASARPSAVSSGCQGVAPSQTTGAATGQERSRGALPGEQTWGHQSVPSYVFGTNDAIEYSSPNVDNLPSVQTAMHQGALTLMRTWAYDTDTDAAVLQRIATIQSAGMHCMMMLGSTADLRWMQHVVTLLGPTCNIYEFGNEPDNSNNGTNIKQLTSRWVADIPQLRSLNPHAVFGGPAVQYPTSSDGSQGNYPSDIAYFLARTAATGVRADFVSYHHYPCFGYTSEAKCIADTPGALTAGYRSVIGWERQYYGRTVPTGISEYNFDPGSNTLGAFAGSSSFMFRWTETAIRTFIADGFAFANQFTSLNYSGYGELDMFHDAAPYAPKAQFYGIVDMGEKNGSRATLAIPNPLP